MKQKLLDYAIRWLAGGLFREIYEGKRGPTLQRWALALKGKKTLIGFLLTLLVAALVVYQPAVLGAYGHLVLLATSVLVLGGFLDKAWWKSSPPAFIGEVLPTLLSFGPVASMLVALAVEFLSRNPECVSCAEWVDTVQLVAAAVATATGWLAARLAAPPDIPEEFKR